MAQGPSVTLFTVPSPASFTSDDAAYPAGHRYGNCMSFVGGSASAVRFGNNYRATRITSYLSAGNVQPGNGVATVVQL